MRLRETSLFYILFSRGFEIDLIHVSLVELEAKIKNMAYSFKGNRTREVLHL